ncbi:hypothetical protein AYR46_08405 [Sphingobium yanoikuyae]|uniref:DUF6961 family protein n=1 Tax=Sphingobium yanoikuyae TaxID=13690 RepID=UPI0007A759DA|nr:hypothetical protein AYR46_08405 [Sphingobium yanoikuyae]
MEQRQVKWAAASMLLKRHGSDAPLVVATRIGEFASVGNHDGVAMWTAIAACLDKMMRFPSSPAS